MLYAFDHDVTIIIAVYEFLRSTVVFTPHFIKIFQVMKSVRSCEVDGWIEVKYFVVYFTTLYSAEFTI